MTWTVAGCNLYSDFIGYSVVMKYSELEGTFQDLILLTPLNSKYSHLL